VRHLTSPPSRAVSGALIAVILGATLAVAGATPAGAQTCIRTPSGGIVCTGATNTQTGGGPAPSGGGVPIDPAMLDPTITDGPGGQPCLTQTYDPTGAVPGLPAAVDGIVDAVVTIIAGALGYGACPGAAPIPSPTEVAQSYFNRSELPGPNPKIEPGRGIVSLPVYLQSGAEMTWEKSVPQTLYGPLTIKATSELYVDWGDGTSVDEGPYSTPGASYADGGGISHPYADDGRFDVTVRQVWSVTWQFGPAGGTFPAIELSDSVQDFPILELQAVTD